jgi:hypothetical protein
LSPDLLGFLILLIIVDNFKRSKSGGNKILTQSMQQRDPLKLDIDLPGESIATFRDDRKMSGAIRRRCPQGEPWERRRSISFDSG